MAKDLYFSNKFRKIKADKEPNNPKCTFEMKQSAQVTRYEAAQSGHSIIDKHCMNCERCPTYVV